MSKEKFTKTTDSLDNLGQLVIKERQKEWLENRKKSEENNEKREKYEGRVQRNEAKKEETKKKKEDERAVEKLIEVKQEKIKRREMIVSELIDQLVKKFEENNEGHEDGIHYKKLKNNMKTPQSNLETKKPTTTPKNNEKKSNEKRSETKNNLFVKIEREGDTNVELKFGDKIIIGGIEYEIKKSSKDKPRKGEKFILMSDKYSRAFPITKEQLERQYIRGEILISADVNKLENERSENISKMGKALKEALEKGHQIGRIIKHAKESYERGVEKKLHQADELDSELTEWIIKNLVNRELIANDVVREIIPKGAPEEFSKSKPKNENDLSLYLDVGGNWPHVSPDGKTLSADHHGEGRQIPTSTAEIVFKMLKEAGLLKEEIPEWLPKMMGLATSIDNLSYMDQKDEKGNDVFNEKYFKESWPNSLYALADNKNIPIGQIISLCEKGIIKDPTRPFTKEELEGEIGKIKLKKYIKKIEKGGKVSFELQEITIKKLCEYEESQVEKALRGEKFAEDFCARDNNLGTHNTRIGRIIYHNSLVTGTQKMHGKREGEIGATFNSIPNELAFKTARAKGFDSYVSWEKRKGRFFINSNNLNLSTVVEDLNKQFPGCAVEVRGTMVFGKITGDLTEEKFLKILNPRMFEKAKVELREGAIVDPKKEELIKKGIFKEDGKEQVENGEENGDTDIEETESGTEQKEMSVEEMEGRIAELIKNEKIPIENLSEIPNFMAYNVAQMADAKKMPEVSDREKEKKGRVIEYIQKKIDTTKEIAELVEKIKEKKLQALKAEPAVEVPEIEPNAGPEFILDELNKGEVGKELIFNENNELIVKPETQPETFESKKENKIESYETIGFADVILDGKIDSRWISKFPTPNTVYEILKDSTDSIKLKIWKGARARVLDTPDFADGTNIQKVAEKPTNIITKELGVLRKNDEGGYVVEKKPVVLFTNEPSEIEKGEEPESPEKILENKKAEILSSFEPVETASSANIENKETIKYWNYKNIGNSADLVYAEIPDSKGNFEGSKITKTPQDESYYVINTKTGEAVPYTEGPRLYRILLDADQNIKPVISGVTSKTPQVKLEKGLAVPIKVKSKPGGGWEVKPGEKGSLEPKKEVRR